MVDITEQQFVRAAEKIRNYGIDFAERIKNPDAELKFTPCAYDAALADLEAAASGICVLLRIGQFETSKETPALLERLGNANTALKTQLEQDAAASCNDDEAHNKKVANEKHKFDGMFTGSGGFIYVLQEQRRQAEQEAAQAAAGNVPGKF